jgi:hypothetical protein
MATLNYFNSSMRTVLELYRKYYELPREVPDRTIVTQIIVQTIFFFCLGFAVSQIIITIVG